MPLPYHFTITKPLMINFVDMYCQVDSPCCLQSRPIPGVQKRLVNFSVIFFLDFSQCSGLFYTINYGRFFILVLLGHEIEKRLINLRLKKGKISGMAQIDIFSDFIFFGFLSLILILNSLLPVSRYIDTFFADKRSHQKKNLQPKCPDTSKFGLLGKPTKKLELNPLF